MEGDDIQVEKQYGIHRIFKFARKKNNKLYITAKKDIINLEGTSRATVVKVEFTQECCFILLCMIVFIIKKLMAGYYRKVKESAWVDL